MPGVRAVAIALILAAGAAGSGACMGRSRCGDKVVRRVPSPDGRLHIVVYDRVCPTSRFTWVQVESPPLTMPWSRRPGCYLVTLTGAHPMTAVWTDAKRIRVGSPDFLGNVNISRGLGSCGGIEVSYDLKTER